MNLVDVLSKRSEQKSLGITFIESSTQEDFLSYYSLYNSALKVLSFLQKKGIQPKSELVLQIDDNKNFLVVFWACILGGIIPVPLSIAKRDDHNKKLSQVWATLSRPSLIISQNAVKQLEEYLEEQGLNNQLQQINSNLLFVEDIFSSDEMGVIHSVEEDDIAFIQFSSGSTGNPKGVMLTHANLIANVSGIASAAAYTEKDSLLSWMPLTHDMGMIGFHINPLFSGVNQYLMPTNLFVRNPRLWLDKICEHKITVTSSPNFGYRYLLKYLNEGAENWDLSSLRIIYNGAEPISEKLCIEFNEKLAGFGLKDTAMCPVYGLAEASVAVSMSVIENKVQALVLNTQKLNPGDEVQEIDPLLGSSTFVNVGKSVPGCLVQIADENNQTLADGRVGRVKIKGTNVTNGYYNNSSAYDEIIDMNGWLNTGDLGFIKDGDLYITGRAKDVIFINGQNYYSHDIEKAAESIEGIELNKIVVISSFVPESESEEVIAFLLHRGSLEKLVPVARSLKMCINEKFGFDLTKIIPVKNIPRTTSGKLQRFELQKLYKEGEFQQVEQEFTLLFNPFNDNTAVPPANDVEEKILRIWEDVLQSNNIGVEGKFIEVGGNSLKAAELINKLQLAFQVELPIIKLFELQTVRKLAAEIINLKHKTYEAIPKAALTDSYPVSAVQKRIYYAWKMDPDSIAYNMPVAIELEGKVDTEKLTDCLTKLIARHDALRMTFFLSEEPRFRVKESINVQLNIIKCEKSEWDDKLKDLISPFDLANGPLFKFFLLDNENIDDRKQLLLLDFNHIISDGQSAYLFINELLQAYQGNVLPTLNASFSDFTTWEQAQDPGTKEFAKQYWAEQLSGELPVLEIARDFPRPVITSMIGKRQTFSLTESVSAKLKELSTAYQVTKHALLFTLYRIFLGKYSGQEDVVIGIASRGRTHPDLQQVQGMFANNLSIRSVVVRNQYFADLLKHASKLINNAIDHQDLAFDDLINFLNIPSRPGRAPIFDTMFLYQSLEMSDGQAADIKFKKYSFDPGFSKFDITMEIEDGDQINYAFEYSTQLFKDKTIIEFSRGFENIIDQVLQNPGVLIEDLSPLGKREFQDFYVSYNATRKEIEPSVTVLDLFEKQVENNPDAVATEYLGQQLSYRELDAKANQVASALKDKAVGRGDIIGLHLKRSPEMIATLLGILKTGAAYLPLEQGTPLERVKFIVQNSGCTFLISDLEQAHADFANLPQPEVLTLRSLFDNPGSRFITQKNQPADLAYVIYTSGTTGLPKGVMIEHGSLVNYILWASDEYSNGESYSFAFYSSISFDLTVTSIYMPLTTGNKIVIYGDDDAAISINSVIRDNLVDFIKLTPSHLRLIRENNLLSSSSRIKKMIVGGEALDTQLATDIYEQMQGRVEIFNEYGPTEATVGCMIYKFKPEDATITVPIGRPIANTQIYLLDSYLKPVPVNVPGEIYIAGDGLARGYLFLDELTTEKFIESPFTGGKKMYKTGDIGKWLPDGNLEYIGRNDKQVKINGNRVEISEIENLLIASGKIKEAVVLVERSKNSNHIQAYFTLIDPGSQLSDIFFRDYLAEKLPYFMIPGEFVEVETMPLTRNGKIDITALQKFRSLNAGIQKVSAQNEIERVFVKIWADVLNVAEVGVTDNFFEAGGDSIKAVQISSRLFEEGVVIKVKDILTYHTIKHISQHAELINDKHSYEQGIAQGQFTPTPIQSWFFKQEFLNPAYFNQSVLFSIKQPLDLTILERTFQALIEHHDTLRVNYKPVTHSLFYNNDHLKENHAIAKFKTGDSNSLIDICNDIRSSFDILNGLLVRMAIIETDDEHEFLFITAHHLVMDGVSWRIFLEDFYSTYSLLAEGNAVSIPQKTASFKEWSSLVNQLPGSEGIEKEKDYWKMVEETPFTFPQDFHASTTTIRDLKKVAVSLDKETTEFLLKGAHKSYNTDVPIVLNTALVLALYELTGLTEFIIEQENHGRHLEDINVSRTLGWFTTMYPVKLTYQGEISGLLKSVKETMRNVPNNGIGYGISHFSSDQLRRKPRPSEIRFNYLGQFDQELNNRLMAFSKIDSGSETDPYNAFTTKLEFNAIITDGEFHMEILYSSKLFDHATVNELSKCFLACLNHVLAYLKDEKDLYFTPSDFSAVELDEDDISVLFGDN
ncbi:non-ribosomal peptide synthetase [Mucilaginibacter sp. OK098]|uniref:non-ribosomal peptide synthetase n=1 Tax=Mucilaginibacter sp. OK098 TaxID=1855297 RepID=UPI000921C101|nr:non-ribosomal peptide synthetase [Mucilaginibacter sp. OK098]SHN33748.1 non-ribosomal peptide synthase domain TIGR01720/amino acid adenylation domain-containing protein [Mucilaginibacter sp. OK098]